MTSRLESLAQGRRGLVCFGLALFAALALAAGSAAQKSVTVDEFQALPHGLAIWRTGDLHLATGEHLLSIVLAGLPVALTPARFDTTSMAGFTSPWQCGAQFMRENALNYHGYFLIGRLVSMGCLLATCGLTYGYARSLYGPTAALVAVTFACLSPNLLAHGPLITPDIYLTCAIVGSLWAFDRLLRRPGATSAAVLGLALGLAALCKLTGLLLFALFPAIAVVIEFVERLRNQREPKSSRCAAWLALLGSLVVGVLVVNLGFLGEGSLTRLGEFHFQSPPLRSLQAWLPGWLPVPLPFFYFLGIDTQLAESGYTAYLLGEFNESGFYHYYLVGVLVKTPLPAILLSCLSFLRAGRLDRRDAILLVTAAALFIFFSLARHKNIGVRYVLFLEPLMAIWIGRLAGRGQAERDREQGSRKRRKGEERKRGRRTEFIPFSLVR
ncbi:MAG TPA: glycosyltransferase family 39 protein, partial [Pirellulales bacterium]|nr:glycosyltransferase family 39 protein [Pirellulales bacterium]